jgi:hypothetical protein
MVRSIALPVATLLLAACTQQPADGTEPTPIASAPSAADCAKVTLDIAPERFAEGRENFAVGTEARTRLDQNFTVAIAQACAEGMMAKQPLVDPRSKEKNVLFIANAPQANQATIYFRDGATWFEGPFFADGRHVQVPGPGAIKEAIYCHTVGATEQEQETSGRCLPD